MLRRYSLVHDAYRTYHHFPRWLQDFFSNRHMTPDELPAEGSMRSWQEHGRIKSELHKLYDWETFVDDLDTFTAADYYLSLFF